MRVAVAHDWLTGMRGGERMLEVMLGLYPDAELFTLLHVPGSVSELIEARPIHTSFINRMPRAAEHYRYYLPLFPAAIERFRFDSFDLVLSISHCVTKGLRPPAGVPHVCCCCTPMRYIWDQYDAYFGPGRAGPVVRAVMPAVANRLQRWDVRTARRVTSFVAISRHIRERIGRCYDRDAAVVYPPVDVDRFTPAATREDFYLIVSALVPYKRIDLAVQTFKTLGRRLVIVGTGPETARLRDMARGNIELAGWRSDEEVADLMARCRAFVFPATEDFGITAVEAQAAGAPVIAHASGGALETVIGSDDDGTPNSGVTGVFFDRHTPESLAGAVERFERMNFDVAALRANAQRFSAGAFENGMRAHIDSVLAAAQ
jgi:glycosyltransferase involved in cell wall biosynthesis